MRSLNIVDCLSLFGATETLKRRHHCKNLNYEELRYVLQEIREDNGWGDAEDLACVSIDPLSEGQVRFRSALSEIGYSLDENHFQHTKISDSPLYSLSGRINFLLGALSKYECEVIVVTHMFEVVDSLRILSHDNRVAVAYFGDLLDYRYNTYDKVPIFDLNPYLSRLFGLNTDDSVSKFQL